MEEYMEEFFSASPSWADDNGGSRAPWDFNNSSNNAVSGAPTNSVDNGAAVIPGGGIQNSMIPNDGSQMEQLHDNVSNSRGEEPTDVQYPFEPSMGSLRHHRHNNMDSQDSVARRITESISDSSQVGAVQLNRSASMLAAISSATTSRGVPGFTNSSSLVSAGNEGAMPSLGHTAPVAPMWRQLYMPGIAPPLPLGQPKVESLSPSEGTLNDSLLSGKRCREEDEDRSGHHESMFGSFGAAPMCQSMLAARNDTSQSMHQQLQGVSGVPYGNHPNLVQQLQSPPTIGPVGGSVRPRIRARRGQATDPHSIAERLRRERIADRMRTLQDLVPSANKTDKALMLDEIIEYVKFLQLQVKVLSMSRLGATVPGIGAEGYNNVAMGASNGGASGSSQDSMSATEKHVARLMEEDMGSAMQYLQGKGLCLMPSSAAPGIPNANTNPRMASSQGLINSADCFRMDLSPPPPPPSSIAAASGNATTPPILPPVHVSTEGPGHGLLSNGAWNSKDTAPTGLDQLNRVASVSTPSATSGGKTSEDPVRRG